METEPSQRFDDLGDPSDPGEFQISEPEPEAAPETETLTRHARERMELRRIDAEAIDVVQGYGRLVYVRGAEIYALGRREVRLCKEKYGMELSRYEGVHVVCSHEGPVITVYRNKDLHGLRRSSSRFHGFLGRSHGRRIRGRGARHLWK